MVIDGIPQFLDRLQQANLLLPFDCDSEETEPIWGRLDSEITAHLSTHRILLNRPVAHHAVSSLPWHILKPGNAREGLRKYASEATPQPAHFSANTLSKRYSKDYDPRMPDIQIIFIGMSHEIL